MPFTFPHTHVLPYIAWKGKTFYQVTTSLRLNIPDPTVKNDKQIFKPLPIQGYRREIVSVSSSSATGGCNSNIRIDEINAPGGYILTGSINLAKATGGTIGVLEYKIPNNTSETPDPCFTDNCKTTRTDSSNVCFRPDMNALRRCRSAGMNTRKFVPENGNDNAYFSDNSQYLHSRNRQFSQNQYSYIRQGSATVTPGSSQSTNNIYSACGLSHCPKYKISATLGNNSFSYKWVNGTSYPVVIPDGAYDIYDLDGVLTNSMISNTHYYTNPTNLIKVTLLNLGYDKSSGTLTITAKSRQDILSYTAGGVWTTPVNCPQLVLPISLQNAYGLTAGVYPSINTTASTTFGTVKSPALAPSYVPVYYKPSNYQYAEQGGVSSSSRTLRIKYNSIMTTAGRTAPYNMALANSVAYDVPVPDYPNTVKDKIGYKLTATPVVKEFGDNTKLDRCKKFIYRPG